MAFSMIVAAAMVILPIFPPTLETDALVSPELEVFRLNVWLKA